MRKQKVLIVGAGLGGLSLAQTLVRAGLEVAVFERDASPWERPQGYRLHLDADALNAAAEALTPPLHRLFEATAMRTSPFTTLLDTDLRVARRIRTDDHFDAELWPSAGETGHRNVDRATVRQVMFTGLGEVCHFAMRLARYEERPDGVAGVFSDGTVVEGDVLVGADGIHSAVRAQRSPTASTVDAGVRAIYGRIPLDVARSLLPDNPLNDIFSIASDHRKVFLGLGAVDFPSLPREAADELATGATVHKRDRYAVCIVGGRPEYYPAHGSLLDQASSEDLQRIASRLLAEWGGSASALVERGDPTSFFRVGMHTSVPFELDAPKRVTLLGDAVHAMTPTLGRGANVAMRDGVLLGRWLKAVAQGQVPLATALARFEEQMLRYGFGVVRDSVAIGEQRMAQNPLPT